MRRVTVSGLPTMIDCDASSSSQFSTSPKSFRPGCVALQIFAPRRGRDIRHAGTVGQLTADAAQMALETIFQKIPNAFFAFLARLLIGLGDVGRHQNAEAKRMILVAMLFQHRGKLLLRAVGLAAVAARREKIAVAALGHFGHGRRAARAGDPHRRKWFLQRLGPEIHIAQRKIAALVRERSVFGP